MRPLGRTGAVGVLLVQPLDQVEEEQKRELFGVADRVRIAAAV